MKGERFPPLRPYEFKFGIRKVHKTLTPQLTNFSAVFIIAAFGTVRIPMSTLCEFKNSSSLSLT